MSPSKEATRTIRAKLTELRVEKLRPSSAGRFYVMDDGPNAVRGFGVIVFPTGKKTFIARYRTRGTRETSRIRKLRLGSFPEITVSEARDRARREIAKRDAGDDPAVEKSAAKYAKPVKPLVADYLYHLKVAEKLKATTLSEYDRQARQFIFPAFGSQKVTEVTARDVAELHGVVLADRPYLANRVLALLSAFFRWTERRRIRPKDSNPCAEVRPFAEEERERYLTSDELQRLGEAMRRALEEGLPPAPGRRKAAKKRAARYREQRGSPRGPYVTTERKPEPANPFAIAAIRFLALTGWREQEVLSLRWSAVNLESGRVNLKDTKTRQSFRTLSAPAIAVLASLPRLVGSDFAFPGSRASKPLVDIKHVWTAVRAAAGIEDVRLHDLRHNFASYGASALYNLPVISKLLGHKDIASTQRYAHLSDASVVSAADSIAGDIAARMDGTRTTPVTPLHKTN